MQLHPKAYRQLISRLWHFRALLPRNPANQAASPLLIYTVAALVLLLAVLEIDLHRAVLLPGDPVEINPIFMSP
jgi:hypothetical protein